MTKGAVLDFCNISNGGVCFIFPVSPTCFEVSFGLKCVIMSSILPGVLDIHWPMEFITAFGNPELGAPARREPELLLI